MMTTAAKFTGDPIARTYNDLRTPRQLSALYKIDSQTTIDVDAKCMELLGCKVEDLTMRAASFLIGYLKGQA